jgi:hypothetical protein
MLSWSLARVMPHAYGVRFLAAVDYAAAVQPIHDWAFPQRPLPSQKAAPSRLPMQFEVVKVALRGVGQLGPARALPLLLGQFDRLEDARPRSESGGARRRLDMAGLALRNIGVGAAQGVSLLGRDAGARATDRLLRVSQSAAWPEDVRMAACRALAWVAADAVIDQLVGQFGQTAASDPFRATCLAETLARRAEAKHVGTLIRALRGPMPGPVRLRLGYAIGRAGWGAAGTAVLHEQKLLALLGDPEQRAAAALALILGGSPQGAVPAAAVMSRVTEGQRDELRAAYRHAVSDVYERDLELGNLHRWVANARAIGRVAFRGRRQRWVADDLAAQLRGLAMQTAPHALSLTMVRYRLLSSARNGDEAAVRTLRFMGQRGAVLALAADDGPVGRLARQDAR